MTDARLQALYREAVGASDAPAAARCPAPERLLALVEREGTEDERLATLDHAASCRECARELELLRAVRAAAPAARRPQWRWLIAASVLVAVAAGTIVLRPRTAGSGLMRGGQGAAGLTVALLPPATAGGSSMLRWHAVPNVVSYIVEMVDAQGTVVASDTTRDTSYVVPASAIGRATRYEWWVRARLADGSTIRSPLRSFSPPR